MKNIGEVINRLDTIKRTCKELDEVYELKQLPEHDMEVFTIAQELLEEYANMLKGVKVQL